MAESASTQARLEAERLAERTIRNMMRVPNHEEMRPYRRPATAKARLSGADTTLPLRAR